VLGALRAWDLGLESEMCVGSSIAVLVDRGVETPHLIEGVIVQKHISVNRSQSPQALCL
jgi:hypothetical protein